MMEALAIAKIEELKKSRCNYKKVITPIDALLTELYINIQHTSRRNRRNKELMHKTTDTTKGGIYMLINPDSKHRYIGQTNNFERRKREHYNEIRKAMEGNKTDNKYKRMQKVPYQGMWLMLILYTDDNEYVAKEEYRRKAERKRLETDYINRIRPTLNTMDTIYHNKINTNKNNTKKKGKNRKRYAINNVKPTSPTKYHIVKNKRKYLTINSIQKLYPLHEKLKIKIVKGNKDLSRWEEIKHDKSLYEIKTKVKKMRHGETAIIKLNSREETKPNAVEIMLANATIKALWQIPNNLLETAYKTRKYRWKINKHTKTRTELRAYKREIQKICKSRFGVRPNEKLNIPVMFHSDKATQERIVRFAKNTMKHKMRKVPKFITKSIKIKTYIKREKTIGEHLINMRKYSLEYDVKKRPRCMCWHPIFK